MADRPSGCKNLMRHYIIDLRQPLYLTHKNNDFIISIREKIGKIKGPILYM